MAIIDRTQVGQPVPAAPTLPVEFPGMPDRLSRAFPDFKQFHDENAALYKRMRAAIQSSYDDLKIATKVTKDNLDAITKTVVKIEKGTPSDAVYALVSTEATARINGDSSLATLITNLQSDYTDFHSSVNTQLATFSDSLTSTANSLTSLTSNYNTFHADVQLNYATKVDAQGYATTAKSESISAASQYTNGQIASLSSVYATPTQVTSSISNAITASLESTSNGTIGGAINALSSVYVTPSQVTSSINTALTTGLGPLNSSITALQQSASGGRNLLVNSQPSPEVTNSWGVWTNHPTIQPTLGNKWDGHGDPWHIAGEASHSAHLSGTPGAGYALQLYLLNGSTRYMVTPGTRYEFSILFATHRCASVEVRLDWYDDAGALLPSSVGKVASSPLAGGIHPGDWNHDGLFATAPANAASVIPFLRGITSTDNDPYVFGCRAYFAVATDTQTEFTPWSPTDVAGQTANQRASVLESTVNDGTTGLTATRARVSTIESTFATQDFATAKKTEAISASTQYTDGQITSLSSVYATPTWVTNSITTAISSALSNKPNITVSSTAPSSPVTGDLWIDSGSGNAMKRWDGSGWIDYTPTGSGASKNATFVQSATPVATKLYDLWIDTGNGNTLKYWNGTAWTESNLTSAYITTQFNTLAAATGYLAGKYTMKVTAGNVVTGFNITSASGTGTDVSDVTFQASSFKIYDGTIGVSPFQVVGGVVKITSSLVLSAGDVGGLGSLATKNSVDLSSSDVTNKSLTNVDSTAATKLAGIASGADVTLTALSGGVLVIGASGGMQSNDWNGGSTGWRITGAGSAFFRNGTFSGTVDIGSGFYHTVIDSSGISSCGITFVGGSGASVISSNNGFSLSGVLGYGQLKLGNATAAQITGGNSGSDHVDFECAAHFKSTASFTGAISTSNSVTGGSFYIGTSQVLSGVGAAIADVPVVGYYPSGTYTSDQGAIYSDLTQLRTAVNSILARMRAATPTIST